MKPYVYLAAPWVRRNEAIAAGELLTAQGMVVTSRWFHHAGDPTDTTGSRLDIVEVRQQAREDVLDVKRADYVVVLNLERSEGKAVETGIALANGIPVISVGKRSNIFQTLCHEVDTLDEAISIILR